MSSDIISRTFGLFPKREHEPAKIKRMKIRVLEVMTLWMEMKPFRQKLSHEVSLERGAVFGRRNVNGEIIPAEFRQNLPACSTWRR
jgi:hypothetical protein